MVRGHSHSLGTAGRGFAYYLSDHTNTVINIPSFIYSFTEIIMSLKSFGLWPSY